MDKLVEAVSHRTRRRRLGARGAGVATAVLLLAAALGLSTRDGGGEVAVSTADRPATVPSSGQPPEAGAAPVDLPATVPSTGPAAVTPTTAAPTTSTTRRSTAPSPTPTSAARPTTPSNPAGASPAAPTVTGLYVIHGDTGALRRVATGRVYEPAWSPNGSGLAFIRDNQLVAVSSDGTGEHVIASAVQVVRPAWSPDGTRLAFIRGGAVFVVAATGGEAVQIGDGGACAVAWSPDGSHITFAGMAIMKNTLEVARPDGSERRVLSTSISCDGRAVWSPDSSRIGYLDFNIGPAVVDVATATKTPLTTQRNMGWPMAWSPGGDEIAFADYLGTTNNLSVAQADGTGVRTIASGAVAPDWSPNGRRIAFLGNRSPDRTGELLTHLYVIDPQGRAERILVSDTRSTHVDSPDWAPDSVQIAFTFTA